MAQIVDIDGLLQTIQEIKNQILESSITYPITVDKGGTGVTTTDALRDIIINQTQPLNETRSGVKRISLGKTITKQPEDAYTIWIGDQLFNKTDSSICELAIGRNIGNNTIAANFARETLCIGFGLLSSPRINSIIVSLIVGQSILFDSNALPEGSGNYTVSSTIGIGNSLFENTSSIQRATAVGHRIFTYNQKQTIVDTVAIGDSIGSNFRKACNGSVFVGSGVANLRPNTTAGTGRSYYDVMIGSAVAENIVGSDNSVLIGHRAGSVVDCQLNYCVAIGQNAMKNVVTSTITNSTAIGNGATPNGDNQVQLGDSATTVYAYGSVQNRSDERDKANITDLEYDYTSFIMGLRPVNFQWDYREDYRGDPSDEDYDMKPLSEITHDGTHIRSRRHNGFIAQEVKELMDSLGFDFAGYQDHSVNGGDDVLSLGYEEFMAPLIKLVQDQQRTIQGHQSQIAELKAAIADLQKINS